MSGTSLLRVLVLVGVAAAASLAGAQGGPSCASDQHAVKFVNGCTYPIWLAELGNTTQTQCTDDTECSSIQFCNLATCSNDTECPAINCTTPSDCPGPSPTCTNNLCAPLCDTGSSQCFCKSGGPACPGGGTCQGTAGSETCQGGFCTFSSVPPNPQHPNRWKLDPIGDATGRSFTMCLPAGWGGRFWARTGCTEDGSTLDCDTGQCGAPDGDVVCTTSANGVTLFEPTLDASSPGGLVDFYDLSLVGGYNVPMRVKPSIDGCPKPTCTSDLNATCPPDLRVKSGTCSSTADCTSGGACVNGDCVIGCIDPCDACKEASPPSHLRCDKFEDAYCCTGTHTESCNSGSVTCFDDADCKNLSNGVLDATCDRDTHLCKFPCTSDTDCPVGTCDTTIGQCGPPLLFCTGQGMSCPSGTSCDTSVISGGEVCVPSTSCCGAYDRFWLRAAKKAGRRKRPYTKIFKAACPSAYSFQYDDPSSTFTCNDPSGSKVGYTVTFCP